MCAGADFLLSFFYSLYLCLLTHGDIFSYEVKLFIIYWLLCYVGPRVQDMSGSVCPFSVCVGGGGGGGGGVG